jgi:pimeloyl-ACP methyl ester carboxylesterase
MAELLQVRNCANPKRRGDVIFVHGLNGNARDYWFPPGEPEKYWPAWLGEDLPDVGVWSLGYENAAFKERKFTFLGSKGYRGFAMPLVDRADDVLLRLGLEGVGERPLVFVGHSMGGLLVKQLLRSANDSSDAKWRAVVEQTRGVCFIATPHIGSDLAKLAHYFGSLLGINVAVDELRPHEPLLRDLNRWYRDFVSRDEVAIKTLSFYEMKPLPGLGKRVVEPGDADPGVPRAGLHPLDEDHNSICKPTSKAASIYQRCLKFADAECLTARPPSVRTGPESPEVLLAVKPLASLEAEETNPPPLVPSAKVATPRAAQPRAVDRVTLLRLVSRLSDSDMALLVSLVEGAGSRVSRHATVPEQAAELIRWAESPTGRGLAVIQEAFEDLRNP